MTMTLASHPSSTTVCPPWCISSPSCDGQHLGQPVAIDSDANDIVAGLEQSSDRTEIVMTDAAEGWVAHMSLAEARDLAASLVQLIADAQ